MRRALMQVAMYLLLPISVASAQVAKPLPPATSSANAAVRALAAHLSAAFGNSIIYEVDIRCANRKLCQAEATAAEAGAEGRARRQELHRSLVAEQPGARFGERRAFVTCTTIDCQVRGAARFVQMKEPIVRGDSAFLALRVYENVNGGVKIRNYAVTVVRNDDLGWKVAAMNRLGFTKG
jgi:hypothetical protein